MLLGGLSGVSRAADAKGNFALHGIGAESCGSVIQQMLHGEPAERTVLEAWTLGFLTGENVFQKNTFDASVIDQPQVLTNIVEGVCQQHPRATVASAVAAVFRGMHAERQRAQSPYVNVKNGKYELGIRKNVLIEVQQALIKMGYLHGNADGVYGQDTQDAIDAFQKAHSIPVTGVPDPETVLRSIVLADDKGKPASKAK
jgi:hypothetical protein